MDNESTVVEEKPVEVVEGATLGNPEGTVTEEQKPVEQNPVEEPPKETHDVRRMKKYIDRAVIAEAELKALKAQVGGQQQPVQREGARHVHGLRRLLDDERAIRRLRSSWGSR